MSLVDVISWISFMKVFIFYDHKTIITNRLISGRLYNRESECNSTIKPINDQLQIEHFNCSIPFNKFHSMLSLWLFDVPFHITCFITNDHQYFLDIVLKLI